MPEARKLKVFLCHASQDKPAVRELYARLAAEGWIDPWLDEEKLLPGMDWDFEIEKAVEASNIVLVCLSTKAVNKEGYLQKELRLVLEVAMNMPEGGIFIIPVRLEECDMPRRLRTYQWVDYFPPEKRPSVYEKLKASLIIRADKLDIPFADEPVKPAKPADPPPNLVTEPAPATVKITPPPQRTPVLTVAPDLELVVPPAYLGEAFVPPSVTVPTWTIGGIEFVKVPHGEFLMGSSDKDRSAEKDEQPQHKVNIPYDFLIARFPVTNAQFAPFASESKFKDAWGANPEKKPSHPVVNVSWQTAMAFCVWLTKKYRASLPRGLVFRLPTEAEWEKAARWRPSPGGRGDGGEGEALIYPWGNDFDPKKCNTSEGGPGRTTPVGAYSPQGDSPYGCADMSGNVWEWTHSLYKKPYPYRTDDGREDPQSEGNRVLRGGSWYFNVRFARCACRSLYAPINHLNVNSGFRVAASPALLEGFESPNL